MGIKILWLRAKTKANFKPQIKMKVVWYTCETELDGMKSLWDENDYRKFIWKLPKNFKKENIKKKNSIYSLQL